MPRWRPCDGRSRASSPGSTGSPGAGVKTYVLRRLLALIPVALVVATVGFVLIHLAPGAPASIIAGPDASAEDVSKIAQQLGLDQPLHVQLVRWYGRLLQGDLGSSIFLRKPVTEAILDRAEPTLLLTLAAVLIAVLIGVPAGVLSARYHNSATDQAFMMLALAGISIPNFLLGLLFVLVFGVLIRGAVVVETVFNLPGLGRLIISAVLRRDYPVVQGVVLVIAGVYMLMNLLVDLSYLLIDPRVRYR